jgi:hypothetical protein
MECENDIKMFQKSTERQRVYIFLGGLDDRFDQVGGEVLRKDPPLGLQASYAYVRREADRKEAMKMEVDKSEPAAMAAKNPWIILWVESRRVTKPARTNSA